MFTPDLSLSMPATTRWKRNLLRSTEPKFSVSQEKHLHHLINNRDPSKFLNVSATPGLTGSKVSTNEDLREVSFQLVSLKKKHDINKSLNFRNQFKLDKEQKQVQKFKIVKTRVEELSSKFSNQVKTLENLCEEIKTRQEEALEARKVYKHILNRMRKSKVFIDEQNLVMNSKLRENNLVLSEEEQKKLKMKEFNIQTKAAFEVLQEYVCMETENRMHQLDIVRKDAEQQVRNTENRAIRMKRQVDIAENAADEERNNKAMQARESLMVHRLFFFLQDVKLQMSKKRFAVIDEAFRKIKTHYGHIEPIDMIEKVLTREQTFSDLLISIAYNKERIMEYKEKIAVVEEKIELLGANKSLSDSNKQWRTILGKTFKDTAADKEKLRRLKIIKEKILFWAKKMLERLGVERVGQADLSSHLQLVRKHITKILKRDGPRIRKSILVIDNMPIEQVLKIYGSQGTRRRTFAMIPMEQVEKVIRELAPEEKETLGRTKLTV